MATQRYVVIATIATEISITSIEGAVTTQTVQPGYVLNAVMWDGSAAWKPAPGTEARADPTGTLAIGQMTTV